MHSIGLTLENCFTVGILVYLKCFDVYDSSLCYPVRFICDNLALPVPCHWERINTDEPYQVSGATSFLPRGEMEGMKISPCSSFQMTIFYDQR